MNVRVGAGGKLSWVFAAIFCVPFCGFGLFAIGLAIREWWNGKAGSAAALGLFGIVFSGVGWGVLWMMWRGRALATKEEDRRAQNPDAPWLWREDWEGGRISSSSKGAMLGLWVFAGFWNLISWPVVFALPKELAKGNHAIWIAMIFPSVGVCLAAWAVRATIRWRKFGESMFEMASVPGILGGALTGAIRPGQGLRLLQEFRVKLACIHRYTTSTGKNRSTHETPLWQAEHSVTSDLNGLIPVSFAIPPDSRETEGQDSSDRILWRLEVTANVPGVDYEAQFEVPVFRVALTPEQSAAAAAAQSQEQSELDAYQRPANSRIQVRPGLHGGTEFMFPPARNPGVAFGLTMFTLVWNVALGFMIWQRAPILIPIVFGFFDVLLLYAIVQMWFGATRVIVFPGRMEISRGALGFGRPQAINGSDIAGISATPGMTAGTTLYHDIQVQCQDGKKVMAGDTIRDPMEADWLAAEMWKGLGKPGR